MSDFIDFDGLKEGDRVGWEKNGVICTLVVSHLGHDEQTGVTEMSFADDVEGGPVLHH